MTYSRHPYDTADDMHAAFARDARLHPDICDEIDHAPSTACEIECARLDVRALAESVAELTDEIGRMALARDPDLARWQAMAEDAERDLSAAREALRELLERAGR